jgi:aspartate/methionine/tyrosine aminotransferase
MRIPIDHNTSIDNLLLKEEMCVFLSNWNKTEEVLCLDEALINNAFNEAKNEADKYFFIDESGKLKTWLSSAFSKINIHNTHPNNFALSSNGTATIFLILHILSTQGKLSVILLSPIYFTYIKLLNNLPAKIEYIQIIHDGELNLNFNELEKIIKTNNTNLIIINDPLFGSGVVFGHQNYDVLTGICNKYKIKLLIDYIYGGMEWDYPAEIINGFFLEQSFINSEIIFVESISKRIFLNGIKTSLIFAHPNLIKEFEVSSVHTIGALTSPQISIFKQLYEPSNRESVLYTINNNINIAKNNYTLLNSLLLGTILKLSNCKSGYFCLLYMPYKLFNTDNNMRIAEYLIENKNILTIPHDRYLHFSNTSYCFRINLTINSSTLLIAVRNLLDLL